MNATIEATACAWCLQEQGTLSAQQPDDSHGICDEHAKAEYAKYKASRPVRVIRQGQWVILASEAEMTADERRGAYVQAFGIYA